MALNIKDPETEALATEVARRLHTSKTGAIRHALRAQLDSLTAADDAEDRLEQAMHMLRTEIWPVTKSSPPLTKQEREEILGYTEHGF